MTDEIRIEIVNWSTYQKRTDFTPTWFALSNRVLENPKFFDFTGDEFKAWIYILCMASQEKSMFVSINFKHAERIAGIKNNDLHSSLAKLEKAQCIRMPVRKPNENVTLHYITKHNKQESFQDSSAAPEKPAPRKTIEHFRVEAEFEEVFSECIPKWIELYNQEYIHREIKKAHIWLRANPNKAKKTKRGWIQFFSGWFERGWDRHTTRGPSAKPTEVPFISSSRPEMPKQAVVTSGEWPTGKPEGKLTEIVLKTANLKGGK